MDILAIDPGPVESGWCHFVCGAVADSGVAPNRDIIAMILNTAAQHLAIERIASYGMAVGREVFETCEWVGRFTQSWHDPGAVKLVYRKDVKMHLCGTPRAKDANIRQALLDLFPRTGGGKCPQIGIKSAPGPLFGVSSHAWPALGVAVTVANWHGSK